MFSETCAPTVSPFQTALVDERPGKVALRPLEGTARAGPFQGWLALRCHQFPHRFARMVFGSPGVSSNSRTAPPPRMLRQQTVPVTQIQFLAGKRPDALTPRNSTAADRSTCFISPP